MTIPKKLFSSSHSEIRRKLRAGEAALNLMCSKNTVVAEMACFKEQVSTLSASTKKLKKLVSSHIAAMAEDTNVLDITRKNNRLPPALLELSYLHMYELAS